MTRLEELQGKFSRLERDVKTIEAKADAEGRSMTAVEDSEVNRILDEIDTVKAAIDTQLRANRVLDRGERVEVVQDEADRGFESLGELCQAVARSRLPQGSTLGGKPCGVIDRRLLGITAAASGMNEALPAEGGFALGTDFGTKLLSKVYGSNPLLELVTRLPVSAGSNAISLPYIAETSRANGSRFGGVECYWIEEAGTFTPKKPALARLEFRLKKLAGLAYATDELLQDAQLLEAVLTASFVAEMKFKVIDAIINGNGAGKPLGILASPSLVTVDAESEQNEDTVVFENISNMWAALWPAGKPNSVWLINPEVEPQLDRLALPVGTAGVPAFLPPGGMSDSPYSRLKGRPVVPCEQCAALGDAGDILLADPSQYGLAEKGGIQMASSIHVQFLTDEMVFRFIYRVDGQPLWSSAITPFKGTQQLSPFIALAARE